MSESEEVNLPEEEETQPEEEQLKPKKTKRKTNKPLEGKYWWYNVPAGWK